MRISPKKINPSLKRQIMKAFVQTIADMVDEEEVEKFLSDFFTEAEFDGYARRLAVAYWLKKKRGYENIMENLKVSSATIASTQASLRKPGLKLAIKKMEADEWANKWAEKIKKLTK